MQRPSRAVDCTTGGDVDNPDDAPYGNPSGPVERGAVTG